MRGLRNLYRQAPQGLIWICASRHKGVVDICRQVSRGVKGLEGFIQISVLGREGPEDL